MTAHVRGRSATHALLIAAALTIALYFIPYADIVLWPMTLLYTLVHELGHGLAAALAGGTFQRLAVWPDASGVASYSGSFGRLGIAFVAAGGLLGPPCAALGLFIAARNAHAARIGLGVFAAAMVIVVAIWVRNPFGVLYILATAAVLSMIAWKAGPFVAQVTAVFVAIELSLSVFSRGDYLFMAQAQTAEGAMPSDTGQIAQALFLPYWFWGGLIALVSVAVVLLGLRIFSRALR